MVFIFDIISYIYYSYKLKKNYTAFGFSFYWYEKKIA